MIPLPIRRWSETWEPDYCHVEHYPLDFSLSTNPLPFEGPEPPRAPQDARARYPAAVPPSRVEAIPERWQVDPACVHVDAGAYRVLDTLALVFGGNGRQAAIPAPSFPVIPKRIALHGGTVRWVPCRSDLRLDPDGLVRAGDEGADSLWVCNPNNPTGLCEDPELILDLAERFRGATVVDEANGSFGGHSLLTRAATTPDLVVVRSFSKTYPLAGVRLGYAVALPEIVQVLDQVAVSMPIPAWVAPVARRALADKAYRERSAAHVRSQAAALARGLRALGFEVPPTESNCMVARIPAQLDSAEQLIEGLNRRGAQVLSGRHFHGLGDRWIRLSPRTEGANRRFLAIVAEVVRAAG